MTLTIPLTPDEETRLIEKAKAEGLTPEEVVRQAIQPILGPATPDSTGRARAAAFRRWTDSFPAGLPVLSLDDVSRENLHGRD